MAPDCRVRTTDHNYAYGAFLVSFHAAGPVSESDLGDQVEAVLFERPSGCLRLDAAEKQRMTHYGCRFIDAPETCLGGAHPGRDDALILRN